ncbi:hypothetical protein J2Z21_002407 [Streptomyces griseochromogenes]|uniref:Uncharacterized protein n=1 Tax=Streptomyces griseochromogenes TaxID=68214 RepID=A0A1B1AR18_9ACTN|nr:hypothetical protein [Streptomyces griseochromogenes]ANP49011.1 hypothetical protein AVL59_04950 [Streptomyces griseochromogenes]MBP2049476.1 hypothetical protein [Streptomyces griseochromogenes]
MQRPHESGEFDVRRLSRLQHGADDRHQDGGGLQGLRVGRRLKETARARDHERLLAGGGVDAEATGAPRPHAAASHGTW